MPGFFTEPGIAWLVAGLVLVVLEVLRPGAFLLWLGLAALGTGLVCRLATLSFATQVIVFAVLAPLSIAVAMTRRRGALPPTVNTPGSGLVGRTATALAFTGSEGRVRLGDSDWPARLVEHAATPAPHDALQVVGVDGLVLLVRPHQITQA
jgi:membrane protein implicated in regulation of membrane protease activity